MSSSYEFDSDSASCASCDSSSTPSSVEAVIGLQNYKKAMKELPLEGRTSPSLALCPRQEIRLPTPSITKAQRNYLEGWGMDMVRRAGARILAMVGNDADFKGWRLS